MYSRFRAAPWLRERGSNLIDGDFQIKPNNPFGTDFFEFCCLVNKSRFRFCGRILQEILSKVLDCTCYDIKVNRRKSSFEQTLDVP